MRSATSVSVNRYTITRHTQPLGRFGQHGRDLGAARRITGAGATVTRANPGRPNSVPPRISRPRRISSAHTGPVVDAQLDQHEVGVRRPAGDARRRASSSRSTARASATSARRRSTNPGTATAARPGGQRDAVHVERLLHDVQQVGDARVGDAVAQPQPGQAEDLRERADHDHRPPGADVGDPVGRAAAGSAKSMYASSATTTQSSGQLVQERRPAVGRDQVAGRVVGVAQPDEPRAAAPGRRRRLRPGRSRARRRIDRRHLRAAGRAHLGVQAVGHPRDDDACARDRRTPSRSCRSATGRRGRGSPSPAARPASRPPRRGSRRTPAPGRAARAPARPRRRPAPPGGGPNRSSFQLSGSSSVSPWRSLSASRVSPGS